MYRKTAIGVCAVALIVVTIFIIERNKVEVSGDAEVVELVSREDKVGKYESAKEITTPDGFINTGPFSLRELIGEKVILIDFWTYSCINCQRTTPYLNAWHKEYEDDGLVIVGIHTPEFGFEKEYENVLAATRELGIEFPVVLDNDFSTWQAYRNRYWPRKYLIDIDGYIVYDHIGEGAYEETEREIQKALKERARRLGSEGSFEDVVSKNATRRNVGSPEVYFGAWRNELLANGTPGEEGTMNFILPNVIEVNKLYFDGVWEIGRERARSENSGAIIFRYQAKDVHMVLGASSPTTVRVYQDDVFVKEFVVEEETLYTLISDEVAGEHILRIEVEEGLEAFTFTFG